jgi:hypothetical protein
MLGLFKKKPSIEEKRDLVTEKQVRRDIARRAEIRSVAEKLAVSMNMEKSAPLPVTQKKEELKKTEDHIITIQRINNILDKVSNYENTKITTLCELILALETGNDKNLIELLRKKDKVVKIKTKY